VPSTHARSLRDTNVHYGSYKASDWMFFLLSLGEVVLANRLPEEVFVAFIYLCKAARLMFRVLGSLRWISELSKIKNLCRAFYKYIYAGRPERRKVCPHVFFALLDIVPDTRSCGPAWFYCHFPIERLIGTLPDLFGSHSQPYVSLMNAISHMYNSELICMYAETYAAQEWAEATGKPVRAVPSVAYKIPGSDDPGVYLLPPSEDPAGFTGMELERMREVLDLEGKAAVPDLIIAKNTSP